MLTNAVRISRMVVGVITLGVALVSCRTVEDVASDRETPNAALCANARDDVCRSREEHGSPSFSSITGGGGADEIHLGDGNIDTLIYNDPSDSPAGAGKSDTIFNFRLREDKIDLRNIDGDPIARLIHVSGTMPTPEPTWNVSISGWAAGSSTEPYPPTVPNWAKSKAELDPTVPGWSSKANNDSSEVTDEVAMIDGRGGSYVIVPGANENESIILVDVDGHGADAEIYVKWHGSDGETLSSEDILE